MKNHTVSRFCTTKKMKMEPSVNSGATRYLTLANSRSRSLNEILVGRRQAAPTTDGPNNSQTHLSLTRTQDLCKIAGDILGILQQKTHGGPEARYVSNIVKWTVHYWQPEERNDRSGRQ
jgi:hypothetical protein